MGVFSVCRTIRFGDRWVTEASFCIHYVCPVMYMAVHGFQGEIVVICLPFCILSIVLCTAVRVEKQVFVNLVRHRRELVLGRTASILQKRNSSRKHLKP